MTEANCTMTIKITEQQASDVLRFWRRRTTVRAAADQRTLDSIILLHQPSEPDEWDESVCCEGCFGEWPCSTQQVLAEWGRT